MFYVLNANIDALLHVSVAHWLVEDDTDGGFRHVVDDASLSVIDFVWHTLLDCSIANDVYNVTDSNVGFSLAFPPSL